MLGSSRSRIAALASLVSVCALAAAAASCGALVGLEDHELAPVDAGGGSRDAPSASPPDAPAAAFDGNPCSLCPTGYGCVDGRCGNTVTEVAASGTHACAVLANGELWCWGKSQLGELGVDPKTTPDRCGQVACRPAPARVPGIARVQHVALSEDVTCALDAVGVLSCWGRSTRGTLGHPPASDPACATAVATSDGAAPGAEPCATEPAVVAIPGTSLPVQIAAGDGAACARTADGNVYCWGEDYLAEAAVFAIPPDGIVTAPTRVAGIASDGTDLVFSGAYGHGCTRRLFDTVWCWGSNVADELGHPNVDAGDEACIFTAPCNATPTSVPGVSGPEVAAGQRATCVRRGDGTVACWGANDAAQLGNGESVDDAFHAMPQAVVGVSNVVDIELRFQTAFAIDGAAHVWAWGYASDGALGTATSVIACTPGFCVPLPVRSPGLDGAVQIAPGKAGGVARKSDGTVWVWGLNDVGQLGHAPGDGDTACADGPCLATPARLTGLP